MTDDYGVPHFQSKVIRQLQPDESVIGFAPKCPGQANVDSMMLLNNTYRDGALWTINFGG